jgi:hypothetical protein
MMTGLEEILAKVTSLFAPDAFAGAVRRPFSVLMGLMPCSSRLRVEPGELPV